jgi:hypothetical protein
MTGLDPKKPPGPNNELFKLDMSNCKINTGLFPCFKRLLGVAVAL